MQILATLPEYQRKGIGSKLLQWGCEKADEAGVESCELWFHYFFNMSRFLGNLGLVTVESSSGIWKKLTEPSN